MRTFSFFFSEFSDKGLGERGRPQFSKNSAGGKRQNTCRSPSHKTRNFLTLNFKKKARKWRSGAEILIFKLGWLCCHPKVTPFFEGTVGISTVEPGGRIWKSTFRKNGSLNVVHTRIFRRRPPPIHSIKFWGKFNLQILRKLGIPQKFPIKYLWNG